MSESPTPAPSWKMRLLYSQRPPGDDRSRMKAVANNLILHLHPAKVPAPALRWSYTWGLGGMSATLAVMLIITGVMLMFRYDASTETAYRSIQLLETEVMFGSLVRGLHHWSANLLVITTFLHMLRVFFTGGFKQGRATNWLVGLALLLLVLAFNFTGYLLPWDQLAYWAVTVGTSLLGYVPLVGTAVSQFLLAGPEVGQGALRNFYAIHVAVLPAILILLLSYHFWKIRKDGGISQPTEPTGSRVERLTTIPHLIEIEMAATAVLVTALVLWAMAVPAPLEALANPLHPPNPAKAAWYFLGLQELLLHMHPLAAMSLTAIILLSLIWLPRWDKPEHNGGGGGAAAGGAAAGGAAAGGAAAGGAAADGMGIYFHSAIGKRAALLGGLLSLGLTPLLVALDEWFIDLASWLPTWPTLLSTGLLPLLLTLGGLGLIYWLFRKVGRTNHSEALIGLYTFIFTSLIWLTLIGIFYRGPVG